MSVLYTKTLQKVPYVYLFHHSGITSCKKVGLVGVGLGSYIAISSIPF